MRRKQIERGAVRKFIEQNSWLTVPQIAEGIGCKQATVREYLRNAVREGRAIRVSGTNGDTYAAAGDNGMPFGCANPLIMMFNNALKKYHT
ncbi:MarR family transcrition regulator [Serratia phage Eta]|uniref:Uncharacterized protein n=1 Tax=Serratia phage Eta TaxID=1282995 RepID=R9VX54_9CAUD|nr:MarR family transcrition regulator [Serratia phage Eta]AGN89466.1 hypothetical protein Eta_0020 [Serratia phage Eta]